jgi:2-iminobutanoate/2-iminopropanoate deaminase
MLEEMHTDQAPAAVGPYSQAVKAGGFLFVSGQIPGETEAGPAPDTIESQARRVFTQLKNILEASGSSLSNVVKTTVFVRSMADFASVNRIYGEFFSKPYPARSCVEVSALPKGAAIEAEAIALASA